MALISVDTLYTTYDTYTSADALDYAQSPAGDDSGEYVTKVKAIASWTSRGPGTYGFGMNVFSGSELSATCAAGATTVSVFTINLWPQQGTVHGPLYAIIGSEIVSYTSETVVVGTVTALNGLVRGLGGTSDVIHTYGGSAVGIFPLDQGEVTSIEQDKELSVFNIRTTTTAADPNEQYPDIVTNDMYTIPESLVTMVKYTA